MSDPETTRGVDPGVRLKQAIRARWGRDRSATSKSMTHLGGARVLRRVSEDVAVRGACRAVRSVVGRRPSIEDAMEFAYGLIVFHDIVSGLEEHVGEVPRFWQERKASQVVTELVAGWNQGGYGLGLVTRLPDPPPL